MARTSPGASPATVISHTGATVAWRRRRACRAESARRERRGQHQRRDQRDRVRDGEQDAPRHRHHQSLARPPDPRTGRHRPARPSRRSWPSRAGIVVVVRRPATSASIRRPACPATPASLSPGNAPSAITVGALMTSDTVGAQRRPARALQLARARRWYDGAAKPDIVAPGHAPGLGSPALNSTLYSRTTRRSASTTPI